MKFTKMSLVAALLIGSSAFAIENTKVSGDAKLYYDTTSSKLKKDNSSAQAAISLDMSTDLLENVSAGTKVTALSTLGLEGQLVNNVWEGTNGTTDSWMVNELWLATTYGKTTAKIGRMALDTPLVFSETWSIVANTFEAAVVINQDIPDTTLVGAYVGGTNSQLVGATATPNNIGMANVIQGTDKETTFNQFYSGAYAAGVVNNSFKPLTVQAWYYQASHVTNAYWLQADLKCQKIEGLLAGIQYSGIDKITTPANVVLTDKSSSVYALMLGYEMKDLFTAKVAYSSVDKDAGAGFNLAGTGQSKLYTEAWWNYGSVTQADTDSFNITVTSPVNGLFDLGIYYTDADQSAEAGNNDLTEFTVTATKSFGPLDVTAAIISADVTDGATNKTTTTNRGQAYLTLNF